MNQTYLYTEVMFHSTFGWLDKLFAWIQPKYNLYHMCTPHVYSTVLPYSCSSLYCRSQEFPDNHSFLLQHYDKKKHGNAALDRHTKTLWTCACMDFKRCSLFDMTSRDFPSYWDHKNFGKRSV